MQIEKALIANMFQMYPENFLRFLLSFLFINKSLRLKNLKATAAKNTKMTVYYLS